MRCGIYVRVSTDDQRDNGYSIDSQLRMIKEYCEKNIATYALPYAYGYRHELPKTKLGKISYKELMNGEDEDEEEK